MSTRTPRLPAKSEFGTVLLALIAERGWTYTQAAAALGIDQSYISRLVRGSRHPHVGLICRMCTVFALSDVATVRLYRMAGHLPADIARRIIDALEAA